MKLHPWVETVVPNLERPKAILGYHLLGLSNVEPRDTMNVNEGRVSRTNCARTLI